MSAVALAIVDAVEGLIETLARHEQEAARARVREILDAGEMPDLAAKWEAAKARRAAGLRAATFTCSPCGATAQGTHNTNPAALPSSTTTDIIELPAGWFLLMDADGTAGWACSPRCALEH
jgi:hypothetical protein